MMDNRHLMRPRRPTNIPDYAEACLQTLVASGLSGKISLGGAFGLLHYLDYRPTRDVDAWWDVSATGQEKEQVIRVIEAALGRYGQVRKRAWGDVVSIELLRGDQPVFSFQIAQRSAQLQPSVSAIWIDVALDSFPDLVAGKMVALIERGAPRDFRDIHALCQAGLTTPEQCWQVWRQRQQLVGSDTDTQRVRLAIETHLARIELHRPLDGISDPGQKAEAEQVRTWFRKEFLDALVD
jgi:hypothetical protein